MLLDPEWASRDSELGADGTPMAVLVSGDGRIASPIVSGGPAVLELLGAAQLSAIAVYANLLHIGATFVRRWST